MTTILLAIVIFLDIIFYIVVFDIILSWLQLMGVRFRPEFIRRIVDPMYSFVRKYIPTRFGMFDFTPMIIIFGIIFITSFITNSSQEVASYITELSGR